MNGSKGSAGPFGRRDFTVEEREKPTATKTRDQNRTILRRASGRVLQRAATEASEAKSIGNSNHARMATRERISQTTVLEATSFEKVDEYQVPSRIVRPNTAAARQGGEQVQK
jgi:hypothetical protein